MGDIQNILANEMDLQKIKDTSFRQMALIYSRASLVAAGSLTRSDIECLPKVPGLLGEMFHIHMGRCLDYFQESSEFQEFCKRLQGGQKEVVEFKKALLVPLRQSVGSCFATAYLIHLQKSDLETLSRDLFTVMTKNTLSRVIEGKEIRIPFCAKTGKVEEGGILIQSSLMKRYEYTVAGLADEKVGFSQWNFQVALGLDHEMKGGLGLVIYTILQEMLDKINVEVGQFKDDIENLYRGLDFDDAAFKAASTRDRMDSIKRAARAKQMQISALEREMEISGKSGDKLSVLYKFFVEQYLSLFPHYFQELYDPEMFSKGLIEEDRPAGFRLVYKHGRSDSRVWTYILNDKEYIASLRDFITITEPILLNLQRGNGLDKEVEHIISEMLLAVDSPAFLKEQKIRISKMHEEHLKEKGNISPYAYISGGNLGSLMTTYERRVNPVKKEKIAANSPQELCYSLIEYMKDQHSLGFDAVSKDPFTGILITNETHAFNFLPGSKKFKKSWEDSGNTYTYMRDLLFSSHEPVVFADTNWGARFLAFQKERDSDDIILILTDGISSTSFPLWNHFFKKDAYFEIHY